MACGKHKDSTISTRNTKIVTTDGYWFLSTKLLQADAADKGYGSLYLVRDIKFRLCTCYVSILKTFAILKLSLCSRTLHGIIQLIFA